MSETSMRGAAYDGEGSVVLGLLIDVPAPYADDLAQWRARAGDPLASRVRPHVTLVPPTVVHRDRVDQVLETVRRRCAAIEPFELRLRGTGSFRPISDVVFVQVSEGIAQCEVLSHALSVDEFAAPRQFPYHPHVTVAQDVAHESLDWVYAELEDFKADFEVSEVVVLEQRPDESWHQINTYPLGHPRWSSQ